MISKTKRAVMFSFLLLGTMLSTAPARSDDAVKDETLKQEPAITEKQVEKLSTRFGVEKKTVEDLRASGMGWGEASHLLAISQKSGQTTDTIMALRNDGMGWGEIAKKYDLSLGELNKEIRAVDRNAKNVDHPKRERIEKRERMEKMERPERMKTERPVRSNVERPMHPDKPGKPR